MEPTAPLDVRKAKESQVVAAFHVLAQDSLRKAREDGLITTDYLESSTEDELQVLGPSRTMLCYCNSVYVKADSVLSSNTILRCFEQCDGSSDSARPSVTFKPRIHSVSIDMSSEPPPAIPIMAKSSQSTAKPVVRSASRCRSFTVRPGT
jgi:hypothetical protein